jgi:hypothetical protein
MPSRVLMALKYTGLCAIFQKAMSVVFGANAPSALGKKERIICVSWEMMLSSWLALAARHCTQLSNSDENLAGFGCEFPLSPSFRRYNMDLFGEVIPDCFINQDGLDGDPYLFQLYRRFGSSLMIPSRIIFTTTLGEVKMLDIRKSTLQMGHLGHWIAVPRLLSTR